MEKRMSGLQFFATNRAMETLGKIVPQPNPNNRSSLEEARSDRLRLETGGYYFLNADAYMSDYFAQVDPSVMPEQAVVPNSKQDVFAAMLAKPSVGRVVVCVHGFNVALHNAITWFRILTDTMRNADLGANMVLRADGADAKKLETAPANSLTAFIGFSWPSNGSTFAYNRDQADAVASAAAFANLLGRIAAHGKSIGLLCHSMGNYMACNALAAMVKEQSLPVAMMPEYLEANLGMTKDMAQEESKRLRALVRRNPANPTDATFLVDNFVMIAPDVERRHVTKSFDLQSNRAYTGPFYSAIEHTVAKATNVYSRFDGALSISTIEKKPKDWALKVGDALASISLWGALDDLKRDPDNKWEMRLGSSAHPITAPPNMTSLNATEIAGRPIDHSDHIDVPALAVAIGEALGLARPAAKA
jgi:esterase/lipase superfamily enzyme